MSEAIKDKKGAFKRIIERTPLLTKLAISIEMGSIDLITQLGYREDKPWSDGENDKLSIICKHAKKEAAHIIDLITPPECPADYTMD